VEFWNPGITLKDNDLHVRLKIGPHLKAKILEQMEIDTKFLSALNVCDYSLLVGVSVTSEATKPPRTILGRRALFSPYSAIEQNIQPSETTVPIFEEFYGGIISRDSQGEKTGTEIYFLGIIDTLTTYDLKKRGEHVLKSLIHDSVRLLLVNTHFSE
jgi:hypothetical protein